MILMIKGEEEKMLPLEIIIVLVFLYCFFAYATWRTQRAKAIHDKAKIQEGYFAALND